MSRTQTPDQGRNKNMTWQPKQEKAFQETLKLSPKFIFAIDHIYENNSFNASKMFTIQCKEFSPYTAGQLYFHYKLVL